MNELVNVHLYKQQRWELLLVSISHWINGILIWLILLQQWSPTFLKLRATSKYRSDEVHVKGYQFDDTQW